jgi:hypothetical protein
MLILKKLLGLLNKFGKAAGYKIKTQKIASLYSNNDIS